jgi:hypothetical protein
MVNIILVMVIEVILLVNYMRNLLIFFVFAVVIMIVFMLKLLWVFDVFARLGIGVILMFFLLEGLIVLYYRVV